MDRSASPDTFSQRVRPLTDAQVRAEIRYLDSPTSYREYLPFPHQLPACMSRPAARARSPHVCEQPNWCLFLFIAVVIAVIVFFIVGS